MIGRAQGVGLAFAVAFISGGWIIFPAGWPWVAAAVISIASLIAWAFSLTN